MRISAISGNSGIYGLENYRISSVQGNPYSMRPVQRIGANADRAGKPLVLVSKEPEQDLYVKDFGTLDNVKSTAVGDFAEVLGIQENMMNESGNAGKRQDYAAYLNDTIGAMGYQNHLRDMLNGTGFMPFA